MQPSIVSLDLHSVAQQKFAIRLSLVMGFLMLGGKTYAAVITGSSAILSDAAESVVHIVAVAFAAFSLSLSLKPADLNHPYGHDKISFFSAGWEGMMIVIAAVYIMYEAISRWIAGPQLRNLDTGMLFVAGAALINASLGAFLIWQGKRFSSLILVANGKHVLTDVWTSLGVVAGLLLTLWTGWLAFDPMLAILVALNIVWSGGKLIRQSVGGLMDEANPELEERLRTVLEAETSKRGLRYHELRYRSTGNSVWVDFHLLFPKGSFIEDAHWKATEIEAAIKSSLSTPVTIVSHLEPIEGHDQTHQELKAAKE
ncbi:MAG: cation transporter [Ignavibacteriales bacterium]|nr:cation transporter [Ignavibacteriales bacterium]